jgi:hypothetical protein
MQMLTPVSVAPVNSPSARAVPALIDHSRTPRVRIDGRLFRVATSDWYLKGFTYGPFRPNRAGEHLPERVHMLEDFARCGDLGATRSASITGRAFRCWVMRRTQSSRDDRRAVGKDRCFFEDCSHEQAVRRFVKPLASLAAIRVFARSALATRFRTTSSASMAKTDQELSSKAGRHRQNEAPDCLVLTQHPFNRISLLA